MRVGRSSGLMNVTRVLVECLGKADILQLPGQISTTALIPDKMDANFAFKLDVWHYREFQKAILQSNVEDDWNALYAKTDKTLKNFFKDTAELKEVGRTMGNIFNRLGIHVKYSTDIKKKRGFRQAINMATTITYTIIPKTIQERVCYIYGISPYLVRQTNSTLGTYLKKCFGVDLTEDHIPDYMITQINLARQKLNLGSLSNEEEVALRMPVRTDNITSNNQMEIDDS